MLEISAPKHGTGDWLFWILWSSAVIVAAVIVGFFSVGIADGSVSMRNAAIWFGLLLGSGVVVGGSFWARSQGSRILAILLASFLAVPGFLAAFFLAVVLISGERWN